MEDVVAILSSRYLIVLSLGRSVLVAVDWSPFLLSFLALVFLTLTLPRVSRRGGDKERVVDMCCVFLSRHE